MSSSLLRRQTGDMRVRHLAVDGLAFRRSEEADHALVVGVVGALGEGGSGEGLPGVLRDGSVDFDILVAEVEAGPFVEMGTMAWGA